MITVDGYCEMTTAVAMINATVTQHDDDEDDDGVGDDHPS